MRALTSTVSRRGVLKGARAELLASLRACEAHARAVHDMSPDAPAWAHAMCDADWAAEHYLTVKALRFSGAGKPR